MNKFLYAVLKKLSDKSGWFKMYVLLAGIVIWGCAVTGVGLIPFQSDWVWDVAVSIMILLGPMFLAVILSTAFQNPKTALRFIYCFWGFCAVAVMILSCSDISSRGWVLTLFGKKFYWKF